MTTPNPVPRLGARVLLFDQADRVLLIHACDPDDPGHHWWELPGGGVDPGETLTDTAIREVAEETGIVLDTLGPCVWIRESRFHYHNRAHHQREHVFLARPDSTIPTRHAALTEEEQVCLLGRRWVPRSFAAAPHAARLPDDLDQSRLSDLSVSSHEG